MTHRTYRRQYLVRQVQLWDVDVPDGMVIDDMSEFDEWVMAFGRMYHEETEHIDDDSFDAEITEVKPPTDEGKEYDHDPRPDDQPVPGDHCRFCAEEITWLGPDPQTDWMHVDDKRNR